jgi:hypothetical protein
MYREKLSPIPYRSYNFSRQEIPYNGFILLKIKGEVWLAACHIQKRKMEPLMIIFALTFAILSLFALSLTGSIATATRRRS